MYSGGVCLLMKLILLMLVTAPLTFGQSARHRHRNRAKSTHSSSRTKASELVRLTEKLLALGATVAVANERVSQPFFSVPGRVTNINGAAVQVFEYSTPSAADVQASRVSADGAMIGTSKPSWMATPHFFKNGKLIVLYVGRNQTIVDLPRKAFGQSICWRLEHEEIDTYFTLRFTRIIARSGVTSTIQRAA
jgi:hypothetical protein